MGDNCNVSGDGSGFRVSAALPASEKWANPAALLIPPSSAIYSVRREITMFEMLPPIVTVTCIGKAPSGTVEAVKLLLSGLNINQAGRAAPPRVVTLTAAEVSAAAAANWAGKEKLKLLPAVTISLGTETVMMPDCCSDGSRTSDTETPPPPATREVPVVALLPTPEGSAALPDVSGVGEEGGMPALVSPATEPAVLLVLVAVELLGDGEPSVTAMGTAAGGRRNGAAAMTAAAAPTAAESTAMVSVPFTKLLKS